MRTSWTTEILRAAETLSGEVSRLKFAPPVALVYNPLSYARSAHAAYIKKYANSPKKILFLGMNPGPFGMAQTGVPFGEIGSVRDWMGIEEKIGKPPREHPKRPVQGFACTRSEVSGRRLWGLFADRYKTAEKFFAQHYVANYCPLVFMSESGGNITPDKLPAREKTRLFAACDEHLRTIVRTLSPRYVLGLGKFAEKRALEALRDLPDAGSLVIDTVLHPSPASPAANKDWAGQAVRKMKEIGAWK